MKACCSRRGIVVAILMAGVLTGLALWWIGPRWSPREQFEHGLAAVKQSDWPEVARAAERLKGQADFAAERHLLRGIALLKGGHPAAALKEFSQLQPEGELREPALLYTGEALYRQDRLSHAQQMFARLTAEQPDNVDAHRWLASIAYDLGAYDHALDELDLVLRLDPTDYRPHILKGYMLSDVKRYHAAAEEYSLALAADPPKDALKEILEPLALAQMQMREYAAALQTLSQVEGQELSAATLARQAECQWCLGNVDAAWTLIEAAKELDPDEIEMLRILGKMELDAGRPESALDPLRRLLVHDPHQHESRHQLAQALRMLGKQDEAEAESRKVAHSLELIKKVSTIREKALRDTHDPEVREQVAELLTELGKTELAATWRTAAAACRQFQQQRDETLRNSADPAGDDSAASPAGLLER